MAIKRYVASSDNTITNAYEYNLLYRATASNAGAADTMEVFTIYGTAGTGSSEIEKSRILIDFPVSTISADIAAGTLPSTAKYYLNLYNAEHCETLPRNFTLEVKPLAKTWTEGIGLDLDTHVDVDVSNWMSASATVAWTTEGGDFTGSAYTSTFTYGYEDMSVDVTNLINEWVGYLNGSSSSTPNYGVCIKMTDATEAALTSSYTKRFFARGTEYFFKRPCIEARWDDSICDDRSSFYASSSALSAADNANKLYLYNIVRGRLRNISNLGTGSLVYVRVYDSKNNGLLLTNTVITGGWVSNGIYSASVEVDSTASYVYDRWYGSGLSTCYYTGTIEPKTFSVGSYNQRETWVTKCVNLKSQYLTSEQAQFRFFVRTKDWQPNIYDVVTTELDSEIIPEAYYRVCRTIDDETVIEFGTGSSQHTKMSYDSQGLYFNMDVGLLEPNYAYTIKLAYLDNGDYIYQPEQFKFRVAKG